MPLGKLEPLYRYLRANDRSNAVQKLLGDMEILAKGGYIFNQSEGIHRVCITDAITAESTQLMRAALGDGLTTSLHVMCQADGDSLYISMSRVNDECSKTCLAIVVDGDDVPKLDYIEPHVFDKHVACGKTVYSSINTVVTAEGQPAKRGFIRYETTFMRNRGRETTELAFKVDFKMTRAAPLYVYIDGLRNTNPTVLIGARAKENYANLEAAWKA